MKRLFLSLFVLFLHTFAHAEMWMAYDPRPYTKFVEVFQGGIWGPMVARDIEPVIISAGLKSGVMGRASQRAYGVFLNLQGAGTGHFGLFLAELEYDFVPIDKETVILDRHPSGMSVNEIEKAGGSVNHSQFYVPLSLGFHVVDYQNAPGATRYRGTGRSIGTGLGIRILTRAFCFDTQLNYRMSISDLLLNEAGNQESLPGWISTAEVAGLEWKFGFGFAL